VRNNQPLIKKKSTTKIKKTSLNHWAASGFDFDALDIVVPGGGSGGGAEANGGAGAGEAGTTTTALPLPLKGGATLNSSRGAPNWSGIKGKAVQIGRGPATVIGEPHPPRRESQPLSRAAGWEGGRCGDDPKARKPAREM